MGKVNAQGISGFINDSKSGEYIIAATVKDSISKNASISNSYGFFSLKVAQFPTKLIITSIGYQPKVIEIYQYPKNPLIIEIDESENSLDEVVIKSDQDNPPLNRIPLGVTSIPIARLKALPTLFGESDIMKALSLTPGVSNGVEGTSGLIVRGGTPDQNLVLIDDTPVYNVFHLFGLISVFNPDAIKNVTLYKSSFPARYGGRLSSVLDIVTKEGNSKKRNLEFGVGLINSRILFEGPFNPQKRNSATFFLSGRLSNLSVVLAPAYLRYRSNESGSFFYYGMYDFNLKINKNFKNNSQLFLSTYLGNDNWSVNNKEKDTKNNSALKWGNITTSIRYINPLTQKLFFKSLAAYTKYNYGISLKEFKGAEKQGFLVSQSTIEDKIVKMAIEYYPNSHNEFAMGIDYTSHSFVPISMRTSYEFNNIDNDKKVRSDEASIFLESKNQLANWVSLNSGIRLVNYKVHDNHFKSFEPRFSADFSITNSFSIKMGYAKMKQFIHLLSNNSAGFPNDLWVPATATTPPENSNQVSLGVSKDIGNGLSFGVEAYRKHYDNLIEYRDGKNFLTNISESFESVIEKNGIGKTQGYEFFLNKSKGRFTGWLSYSLSWNKRRFGSINNGEWFAANFDRRHNLAIIGNYKLSNRVDISSNWVFQTGSPTNLPIASMKQILAGGADFPVFIYGDRNSFRLPSYHRLDFGINFKKETYRQNLRTWSLGIYNLYNHKNPFYIDVDWSYNRNSVGTSIVGWRNNLVKRSVIPFLPYVSYSLKIK